MSRTEAVREMPRAPSASLPTVLRLALREMRGGLAGFRIFIACVALGVAVITAIGALSDALRTGLERQGQEILGGDVTMARMHARGTAEERAWLAGKGRVSETATMRAMAQRLDGTDQSLAELKGVDDLYPLVGTLRIAEGGSLAGTVRGTRSAVVEPILLERLQAKVGDRIRIGKAEITIAGTLATEPDQLIDRLTYGPRVMVSLDTLEATGLVQPGTLVRWRYAAKLGSEGSEETGLVSFREALKARFPESGFTVTDRRNPSPQLARTLERLRQFLTLIGLTALLVGGIGVANAVATFVDRRRKVIATLKSVGASSGTVFRIFLIQIMAMATIGVAIGIAAGVLAPTVVAWAIGDALPVKIELAVGARSVGTAVLYGILVASLFTLWPLGRAERVSAAVLFRDEPANERAWPRPYVIAATAATLVALGAVAVLTSESQRLALIFCAALAVVFAVFLGLGWVVTWTARRIPRPRIPEFALALGNIGAPGGLARNVVLSLGAGLSLLVAVALTDASLVEEMSSRLPEKSPNYFVLDIPKNEVAAIEGLVKSQVAGSSLITAPMLRGRLVRLKGVPVEEIKAAPEATWVLSGDRGLTYAETVPDGSTVTEGTWWPADHSGEPLVSFEAELAQKLGLAIGDEVTVNVLGRNVTARIASLRRVDWESLSMNFVMVFSPNTLAAAPHNLLATILLPKGTSLEQEATLGRKLGAAHPTVTAIRVKEAISAFNAIFVKVMTAVRVAGSVTLIAGALVLAGALATAQRRRILDAVILKAVGATRARILGAHLAEYVLLASVTALFAVGLGALASWGTLTFAMEVPFAFSWLAVLQALALALLLVMLFGGAGTWQVLRARAVPYLRSE